MISGRADASLAATNGSVAKTSSDAVMNARHAFLCHNGEGWGPLSNSIFDFTPCFLAVPNAAIALFGVVIGGATIWWLRNKESKHPTPKNWHYYLKLVSNLKIGR
jgi:hypothetical protein